MKKILILLLLIDAAVVFVLQVMRINPWIPVCLYWVILTAKNALDLRDEESTEGRGYDDEQCIP